MDRVAELIPNLEPDKVIEKNLQVLNTNESIGSDRELVVSDNKNLSEHNRQYSRLLKMYVNNYGLTMRDKRKNKEEIYKISKNMLIWVPIVSALIIVIALFMVGFGLDASAVIPELVVTMGTVIGTYFMIIKIITNYLFNKDEEKNMAEIISKIQKYDSRIRDGISGKESHEN